MLTHHTRARAVRCISIGDRASRSSKNNLRHSAEVDAGRQARQSSPKPPLPAIPCCWSIRKLKGQHTHDQANHQGSQRGEHQHRLCHQRNHHVLRQFIAKRLTHRGRPAIHHRSEGAPGLEVHNPGRKPVESPVIAPSVEPRVDAVNRHWITASFTVRSGQSLGRFSAIAKICRFASSRIWIGCLPLWFERTFSRISTDVISFQQGSRRSRRYGCATLMLATEGVFYGPMPQV